MDAANLLKPALARGELRCIGATTLDEYRKRIEKDAALERRFQPVFVASRGRGHDRDPPRAKQRYEVHHGVRIQDSALVAAATLSDRYMADRFLPDKAIDLVDEAAAPDPDGDRLHADGDRRGRSPHHAARDRASVARFRRGRRLGTAARREQLERTLAEEREVSTALSAEWQHEKEMIGQIAALQEQLEQRTDRSRSRAAGERSGHAAELRYGTIPELTKKLDEAQQAESQEEPTPKFVKERSTRRMSRRSSPSGRACRSRACSRARSRSSSIWRTACTNA